MTQATDFTRNDCQLGKHRKSYDCVAREYRCGDCSGRVVMLGIYDDPRYPDNWYVACTACGSHNFIHERQAQRQRGKAARVMSTLPQDVIQAYLVNRKGD